MARGPTTSSQGDQAAQASPPVALSPDLERLFSVPLKEFVAERDRAARALKAAGRTAEAKEVARIPRPGIPAWVVNQLARRQPALIARLLEATAELRRAQQDVLGERESRARYAESTASHRDALARLRAAAEEILASSDHAGAAQTIERVMRNLRAGAASEPHRPLVQRGRLLADVDEPDLSDLIGQLVPRAPAARPAAPATPAVVAPPAAVPAAESRRAAAEEADRARRARQEAEAQAQARAREEAARLREQARARAEAERRVTALRAEAKAAGRTVDAALAALEVARSRLHEAESKAEAARAAADDLSRQLAAAETALASLPDG
jgi:hypothetical protein